MKISERFKSLPKPVQIFIALFVLAVVLTGLGVFG